MTTKGPEYQDLPLTRASVPALDDLLGKAAHVGPYGWVRALDYMGSDAAVVEAARQSYYQLAGKRLADDRHLLRYLMRHWHTTPFEMAVIKFHVRAPLYVVRQWFRHRTGSFNEYSFRYSEALPYIEETGEGNFRLQSTANKQGSGGILGEQKNADLTEASAFEESRTAYAELLEAGVAREQARKVLPMAQYTEFVWKVDLHNLLNFLRLRLDEHAQEEIREFAEAVAAFVTAWVPHAWEAFVDYRLESMTLTRLDIEVMQHLAWSDAESAMQAAEKFGWLVTLPDGSWKTVRERSEFEVKMKRLGVGVPWLEGSAA